MHRLLYSLVLACLGASSALAGKTPATLEVISGPVFVDQGQGLVVAERFTLLRSNDRILVKARGSALLVNNHEGCFISLREAGLYLVPDMDNCHTGEAKVLKTNVIITPVNGVYTPVNTVIPGAFSTSGNAVWVGLGFSALVGAVGGYAVVKDGSPVSVP
jgi:hypothetical protein